MIVSEGRPSPFRLSVPSFCSAVMCGAVLNRLCVDHHGVLCGLAQLRPKRPVRKHDAARNDILHRRTRGLTQGVQLVFRQMFRTACALLQANSSGGGAGNLLACAFAPRTPLPSLAHRKEGNSARILPRLPHEELCNAKKSQGHPVQRLHLRHQGANLDQEGLHGAMRA